jgi:hypothetical protein
VKFNHQSSWGKKEMLVTELSFEREVLCSPQYRIGVIRDSFRDQEGIARSECWPEQFARGTTADSETKCESIRWKSLDGVCTESHAEEK